MKFCIIYCFLFGMKIFDIHLRSFFWKPLAKFQNPKITFINFLFFLLLFFQYIYSFGGGTPFLRFSLKKWKGLKTLCRQLVAGIECEFLESKTLNTWRCLSACLSACLSVCLPVCLPACLSFQLALFTLETFT